jgi:hypothetical protein
MNGLTRFPLSNISVLDRASGYMDCLVKEATQIRFNQNNFNRDNGFTLSQAWNPVTKLFTHDIDPKWPVNPPTDLSRKQTGSGVNLDRMFFPTIIRLSTQRTRTEMVFEMFVFSPLIHLTWLIAQENFIILSCWESNKSRNYREV